MEVNAGEMVSNREYATVHPSYTLDRRVQTICYQARRWMTQRSAISSVEGDV
jgi:hypothetical protein